MNNKIKRAFTDALLMNVLATSALAEDYLSKSVERPADISVRREKVKKSVKNAENIKRKLKQEKMLGNILKGDRYEL